MIIVSIHKLSIFLKKELQHEIKMQAMEKGSAT
jgi:hypothetical protein